MNATLLLLATYSRVVGELVLNLKIRVGVVGRNHNWQVLVAARSTFDEAVVHIVAGGFCGGSTGR